MLREDAYKLRDLLWKASKNLDDNDAVNCLEFFPKWKTGTNYKIGDKVTYNEKLYECLQAHKSQSDWYPPVVQALFKEVVPEGVIPVWVQPTGAHDAYNKGDRVLYPDENSPIYESLIDANVWSPSDYPTGWVMLDE